MPQMNVDQFLRPNVAKMEPYVPGIQPKSPGIIKLNTNENPYPPPDEVIDAVKHAAGAALRLYPDPLCDELRGAIAHAYGVSIDQIIAGNGSDEILSMIMRAFVDPGDKVLLMYPTYSLYKVLCEAHDGVIVECELTDDFSIPEFAYSQQCKLCFIPNPNVPSGNFFDKKDLSRLATTCGGILVIDEAYVDFASDDCLDLLNEHPNIIITRTFSKSFSLAGMRIGYAVADDSVIKGLMKIKDSYNLNRLSVVAATAAIRQLPVMQQRACAIAGLRDKVSRELESLHFTVLPSQTNFIFVKPVRSDAKTIYEKLLEQNILVRYFDQPRVNEYIRITIGTPEEMNTFIETIQQIMEQM